jgi:regulator of replication initiation timing
MSAMNRESVVKAIAEALRGIHSGSGDVDISILAIEQFNSIEEANKAVVDLHMKGISLAGEYNRVAIEADKLRNQLARKEIAANRSQGQAKLLAELTKRILAGESTEAERLVALETISAIEVVAASVSVH